MMRIVLNSSEHQLTSGYAYKLLISTHPHDQLVLHFVLQGTNGSARERVDLASEPPSVKGECDTSEFSESEQACFEEWFARNADVLVDAYRNARIFDYEQAFD